MKPITILKTAVAILFSLVPIFLMTHTYANAEMTADSVSLQVEFSEPIITQSDVSSEYSHIEMPGMLSFGAVGEPVLPVKSIQALIPPDKKIKSVDISASDKVILPGVYKIEPGQPPTPISKEGRIKKAGPDSSIYGSNDIYRSRIHKKFSRQRKLGYDIAALAVSPVEYKPQSGEVSYYRKMQVKVNLESEAAPKSRAGARPHLRGKEKEKNRDQVVIRRLVVNAEDLKIYDSQLAKEVTDLAPLAAPAGAAVGSPRNPDATPIGNHFSERFRTGEQYVQCEYIVITSTCLENAFEPLRLLRAQTLNGAIIVTTEWIYGTAADPNYPGNKPHGDGEDHQTMIRNFIIDAYNHLGTNYVLLGGDGDVTPGGNCIIPIRGLSDTIIGSSGVPGYVDNTIPADLYYACLDGTFDNNANGTYGEREDGVGGGEVDLLAEVYVGRAPVDNITEATNFVNKTLAYDSTSVDDPYLNMNYMAGEKLFSAPHALYATKYLEQIRLGSPTRGTDGFLSNAYRKMDARTLYDDVDFSWTGSSLVDIINNGVHILNHFGHSINNHNMKLVPDEPNITLPNDNAYAVFTNTKYFIAYSQGCYAAAFDNLTANPKPYDTTSAATACPYDSMAEYFTVKDSPVPDGVAHGAAAYIGNSRYGWIGVSTYFNRSFWDALFAQNISELGKMNQDSKEDYTGYVGDDTNCMRWCYFDLNLFGDPALKVHLPRLILTTSATFSKSAASGSGQYSPGEIGMLKLGVLASNSNALDVTVTLTTLNPDDNQYLIIDQASSILGAISQGETKVNSSSPIRFHLTTDAPLGRVINCRLTVNALTSGDDSYVKEIPVTILVGHDPLQRVLWCYPTNADSKRGGAAGDIDGDGKQEVVFGIYYNGGPETDRKSVYAINAEDGSLKWTYTPPDHSDPVMDSSIEIIDVDGDGNMEVIFGDSAYHYIRCLDGSTGELLWVYQMPTGTDSPASIADIDNDGKMEVVVGDMHNNTHCFKVIDHTNIEPMWTNDEVRWHVQTYPVLVDLSNDHNGKLDVIVGSYYNSPVDPSGDKTIRALNWENGTTMWTFPTNGDIYNGPAVADFNHDGFPEVAFITVGDSILYVCDRNGTEICRTDIGDNLVIAPILVADLDEEEPGNLEIVVCSQSGYVYAYTYSASTLTRLWEYNAQWEVGMGGAVVADLTGDGYPEVVFGTKGQNGGKLIVLDGRYGEEIDSFDARTASGLTDLDIDQAPVITDLDGDGALDIFFVGGKNYDNNHQNNYGRAFAIRGLGGTGMGWTMFRHDLRHTGDYSAVLTNDLTPPSGTIIINNGAATTDSAVVTLMLSATDTGGSGVAYIKFSHDYSTWSNAEPYSATKTYVLPSIDGIKTVYAMFGDAAGNWSDAAADAITLLAGSNPDKTPPSGSISITSGVLIGGVLTTDSRIITLSLPATDNSGGSGVAAMKFRENETGWSAEEPYNPTKTYMLSEGDEEKTVQVMFMDGACNWSVAYSAGITLDTSTDTTSPTGTISFPYQGEFTNINRVWLNLSAQDLGIGMGTGAKMKFSNDNGATWSASEDCVTGNLVDKIWSLTPGDGYKTVSVKFKDAVPDPERNWSRAYSRSIFVDTVAPTGTVSINNGASTTYSRNVQLTLSASDNQGGSGISRMSISNDNVNWTGYSSYKSWILSEGEEEKTVYVKFYDRAVNTITASATINFQVDINPPTGTIDFDGGAQYTWYNVVHLILSAQDSGSGMGLGAKMKFSDDSGVTWSAPVNYATSRTWQFTTPNDGPKTVSVKFKDVAGNWSSAYSRSIFVDTANPTGTVLINNGAGTTNTPNVQLTLSASDNPGGSGITQMKISNITNNWANIPAEPFATTRDWTLAQGPANMLVNRIVYVRFYDAAGHFCFTADPIFLRDTTLPSITTQPVSLTLNPGQQASFTVAASGAIPLTYQWNKDGATIPGATDPTYTIASVASGDAGSYTCTVSNTWGSVTSLAATLAVAPSAPSNLLATPDSETRITLTWQDNSGGEQGFAVERSPDGVTPNSWRCVGPGLGANITTFTNTGLSCATTYYYRVRARAHSRGVGYFYSDWSNIATATTLAPTRPLAPSDLRADVDKRYGVRQINLTWRDNSNNELFFVIMRKIGSGLWDPHFKTLGANTTSYSDTNVTPGTTYTYLVYAYNYKGTSGYSNSASATITR